jgi:eukaryotic-like serine/threonine-protein kinase
VTVDVTRRYVLAEDVVVLPVNQLSSALREKFAHEEGDFAITRRHSRRRSTIVNAKVAMLLDRFKSPNTLIDGILSYAASCGERPDELIEQAGTILLKLIQTNILTIEDSSESKRTVATLSPGDRIGGFIVDRSVQIIDDCEVYSGRNGGDRVALKLARDPRGNGLLAHEAAVLAMVPLHVGPQLIETGDLGGRAWLAIDWIDGIHAGQAAKNLRAEGTPAASLRLSRMCHAILKAFADLHASGLLHGDVHPRNILVQPSGQVKIVDFAFASSVHRSNARRGGIESYFEPERAKALLAGEAMPENTAAAEQYALAAMSYELLTGSAYLQFSAEKYEMLRQIAEDDPVPFALRGLFDHLQIQNILARALSKDARDRFDSVTDLATAFQSCLDQIKPASVSSTARARGIEHVDAFLGRACEPEGDLISAVFSNSPFCSVVLGAAGIAYALYRASSRFENAAYLAAADLWIQRALATVDADGAFYNASLGLVPGTIGATSLYHGPCGVHCVHALISGAMGDFVSQRNAAAAFLTAASQQSDCIDLMLGRSGLLLGATLLLDAVAENPLIDQDGLRLFGRQTLSEIWRQNDPASMLGIAHGPAGMAYASLGWCRRAGADLPAAIATVLEELSGAAERGPHGLRWRRLRNKDDYLPSWCNGAAGFVHLWTEAYRTTGRDDYLALAEGAAHTVWKDPEPHPSLCCGYAGRAYALLNVFKHTGDRAWVDRARELEAKARVAGGYGLYSGRTGAVLLTLDVDAPERAYMPMFENDQEA